MHRITLKLLDKSSVTIERSSVSAVAEAASDYVRKFNPRIWDAYLDCDPIIYHDGAFYMASGDPLYREKFEPSEQFKHLFSEHGEVL